VWQTENKTMEAFTGTRFQVNSKKLKPEKEEAAIGK
jgi:hypothetical protein